MNQKLLNSFKFWETLDNALVRDRFEGNRRISLYPSEASVVLIDPETNTASIAGGCHRKSFYRIFGFPEAPNGIKAEFIFEFGRQIEDFIAELVKIAGIYDNRSVKFWDPKTMVSGEIDIIARHPDGGGKIFIECKSTYGYIKERELFGGRNETKGRPMIEHVLQLSTYLWNFKDDEDLVGGKLVYLLRDNMSRIEFDITLEPDATGRHRVVVDGVPDMRFYYENVIERFELLGNYVKNAVKELSSGKAKEELELPPRDYELVYTDDKIEAEYAAGRLSKSKYDDFKKKPNERPGDWNCSYCGFKDICWTQEAIADHLGVKGQKPQKKHKRVEKTT
jgi:CRISPR/Cas system-associated exonuclease Cas4 (RecB family)